jgi:hypothetical protein
MWSFIQRSTVRRDGLADHRIGLPPVTATRAPEK